MRPRQQGQNYSLIKKLMHSLLGYEPPKPEQFFMLDEDAQEGKEDRLPDDAQNRDQDQSQNQGQDKGGKDQQSDKNRLPREKRQRRQSSQRPDKQQDGGRRDKRRAQLKKPEKMADYFQKEKAFSELEIFSDLENNRLVLAGLFHLEINRDVVVREFFMAGPMARKAFLIFMEGMADKNTINNNILQPLMHLTNLDEEPADRIGICKKVVEGYLPANQVRVIDKFQDMVGEVTAGSTVIFIDGCRHCISVETKGFEHRNVEAPRTEQVVQGPQEGFTENIRVNTSQIRRIIQSPELITEYLTAGTRSKTSVAVMYMGGIANPTLVAEVKRRISGIKADYLAETGILEGYIEDHSFSLLPQVIKTERPDRAAAALAEGRVAILINGSPFVIVAPVTFFDFLHNSEDYYCRIPDGMWLRLIRICAMFITLLLPGFYVALATYHQEMIPTDLLLAISGAKERVPFPTIIEVILMEFSFELVREGGIRVPGLIGPVLGIVGTLILGQAAVAANIVSPILIIVVALTGLSAFAIPNYSVSFGFRVLRFFFVFAAYMMGFVGMSAGLVVLLFLLSSMRSFGVPFIAPVVPGMSLSSGDLVLRTPLWKNETRPDFLQPKNVRRQPQISRAWADKNGGRFEGENSGRKGDGLG